jgi:SAM-dependent methyltransferase
VTERQAQSGQVDRDALDRQRDHWTTTFATRPDFLGAGASDPARAALTRFQQAGARTILELGAGQGRDSLLFAEAGLRVTAVDYAADGLGQIVAKAESLGIGERIQTVVADVREPLSLGDATFDVCYSHMLFCMALTTPELERLAGEVARVVRPGGLVVYTVRTTADPHYGSGIDRGDNMYEMGGFIVHFFDRGLVDRLAAGFDVLDVAEYEEGKLPRRLYAVTMRKR